MIKHFKITIVTVVRNGGKTLKKTMLSVLNQTYENIEYIVIDGGSKDETIDIIKNYELLIAKGKFPNIEFKWISEPDKGIYDAMNKGIEKATGEWINFMNSDDRFINDCIVSELFINKSNVIYDVLFGHTILHNEKRQKKYNKYAEESTLQKPMSFCHQSSFVKTKWLKQYMFDGKYKICADKDFFIRINRGGAIFNNTKLFIAEVQMFGYSNKNRYSNLLEVNDIYMKYGIRTKSQGLYYKAKAFLEQVLLLIVRR